MKFHVLTLFPEMIENAVHTSITGRAAKKGTISLNTVNIRDFSVNKHMRVDDYPYGGGAGMVMEPEPVYRAWKSVADLRENKGKKPRCIYLTPQGKVLNQTLVEELAMEEELMNLPSLNPSRIIFWNIPITLDRRSGRTDRCRKSF